VVQPRQLPDGLLEVHFQGQKKPDYFLVEIATYYEKRLLDQVVRDAQLVWMARKVLPEVLALILCQRGSTEIPDTVQVQSRLGWTAASLRWKVVPLWSVPTADLLAAQNVGLIPWVPLTQFEGPPEPILQQCRQRIEQQAPRDRQANLLAITQVLLQLRFPDPELLSILGGESAMIESPLLKEFEKKTAWKPSVKRSCSSSPLALAPCRRNCRPGCTASRANGSCGRSSPRRPSAPI
jgi:hypothetical protein